MEAARGLGDVMLHASVKLKLLTILCAILALTLLGRGQASAELIQFDIAGQGAGSLNGIAWSAPFDISLVGDNSTVSYPTSIPSGSVPGSEIAPLISATVTIHGVGTMVLLSSTVLGLDTFYNGVFFGMTTVTAAGISEEDLFDFFLAQPDAATFNYQPGYGPVSGTNVFALNQFTNIGTTLGSLSFNQSSDISFSSLAVTSPTPLSASLPLFATGLGVMGLFGWRRKRKA